MALRFFVSGDLCHGGSDDVMFLAKIYHTLTYGYAKTKLKHAIEHLDRMHENDRLYSLGFRFLEGFDHVPQEKIYDYFERQGATYE